MDSEVQLLCRYNYYSDGMAELQKDMIEFEAGFNSLRNKLPKRTIWRECTAQHFNTSSGEPGFPQRSLMCKLVTLSALCSTPACNRP